MSDLGTPATAAVAALLLLGIAFTAVAMIGVVRLPDVYTRAHTASQADTLGAGFALLAVAIVLGLSQPTIKTLMLLFFIFLTNPTAAHAIARAAHESDVVPWTPDATEDAGGERP